MTDRGDIKWKSGGADLDNPTHSFPVGKLPRWISTSLTKSSTFCEYKFSHRRASIRFVTVPRRHAIFRSNTVDDIIRYIKTLLTRQCFPRVHRRESDIACNSVCFWVTQHCRDVDGIHSALCTFIRDIQASKEKHLSLLEIKQECSNGYMQREIYLLI